MDSMLLEQLSRITEEEYAILNGDTNVKKELYTSQKGFVIDSARLLEKNKLIKIRTHTRFIHFPRHRHNYVEMTYMCSGSTIHIINDTERVELQAGDILILNQNAVHEILPAGKDDIAVNFIILPEFFSQAMAMMDEGDLLFQFISTTLSADSGISSYLHFRIHDLLPVENLIENMVWNLLSGRGRTSTVNQISMGLLFLNLMDCADLTGSTDSNLLDQNLVYSALKYIKGHFKDGSLEDFAASVNQKPYTLSRLLKKRTGRNFKELLMEQKLNQAVWLLTKTTLSTESVFHAVGYENSSFFYRKFKETFGMSPKEYRKMKQNQEL